MDNILYIIFCKSTATREIHYPLAFLPYVDKWIFLEPLVIWGKSGIKKANVDKV